MRRQLDLGPVGHLGDRIGGGPALVAAWPQEQRTLGRIDRETQAVGIKQ